MLLKTIDHDEEQLVEFIYQATITPQIWPELLKKLHEFVFSHFEIADHQQLNDKLYQTIFNYFEAPNPMVLREDTTLDRICKHFAQALKITQRLYRLEENQRLATELFNRSPVALLIVDEFANIRMLNSQAIFLLENSGILENNTDRIKVKNPKKNRKLHQLITEQSRPRLFRPNSRGLSLESKPDHNHQMVAIVLPLCQLDISVFDHAATAAIIIANRHLETDIELSAMADIYQLTPKEIRIVKHIARGASPKEISQQQHVSYNTVRSQLKSIYLKMDVKTQSELANLVLAGAGAMLFRQPDLADCHRYALKDQQQDHFLTLNDGRELCYREYGDPNGIPLLFCHSILGSRMEHFIYEKDWTKHYGFRLIIPDRPGYGFSEPNLKLSYNQWSEDIEQLCEQLKLDEIAVLGYASGGIYAASLGANLAARIRQLVLVCSGSPVEKEEDFEHTGPLFKMHVQLATNFPSLYQLFWAIIERGLNADPQLYGTLMAKDLSPIDIQCVKNKKVIEVYEENIREVNRQGVKAFSNDLLRMIQPWNIKLERIQCQTTLWNGDQNNYIPITTSSRFADKISHSELHIIKDEGHMLIHQHWPEILSQLKNDWLENEA